MSLSLSTWIDAIPLASPDERERVHALQRERAIAIQEAQAAIARAKDLIDQEARLYLNTVQKYGLHPRSSKIHSESFAQADWPLAQGILRSGT